MKKRILSFLLALVMCVSIGTGTTAKAWAGNDAMQRGEATVIEAVMLNLLDYATKVAEIEVDLMTEEPSMDQALIAGLGKTTEEGKMLIRIYEHLKLTGKACWDLGVILVDTNSVRKELLAACLRNAQATEKGIMTGFYYAFESGRQDYNNDTSRTEEELRQIAELGIKDVDYTVQSLRESAEQPIFDLFFDTKSPKLINQAADGLEELAAAIPDSWYTYQMGYATAKAQDDRDPTIYISMKNVPKGELPLGKVFPVKGKISSEFVITKVTESILDSEGKVVQSNTVYPNKKEVDIAKDGLDKLRFKKLTAGEYTFTLDVENKAGSFSGYGCDFSIVKPEEPVHKHEEVIDPAVEATCTAEGKTEGKHCASCDDVLVKQEVVPAKGHSYGEWKVTTAPTCIEVGVETRTCADCGSKETRDVPKGDHGEGEAVKENEIPATCEADGSYDEVVYCPVCEEELERSSKVIPAAGHKDADENYICDVCEGKVCTNHKPETVKGKAATCTEAGLTYGEKCSICGEVLTEQETIPALGHKFSGGKCSVCGVADPDYEEPTPPPVENPFTDVSNDAWYAKSVLWAKESGVTGGKTETTFGPNDSCTRAQVVTFLWAANGKPEPKLAFNPFDDVSENDWYYKPVLWAVENGITGGVSKDLFGPEQTCTRGQIVTFLYAAVDKPAVNGTSSFKDVADGEWFAAPVIWAAENDVTGGIGNGKFGPNNTCTRAQVVTFLYKVYG